MLMVSCDRDVTFGQRVGPGTVKATGYQYCELDSTCYAIKTETCIFAIRYYAVMHYSPIKVTECT